MEDHNAKKTGKTSTNSRLGHGFNGYVSHQRHPELRIQLGVWIQLAEVHINLLASEKLQIRNTGTLHLLVPKIWKNRNPLFLTMVSGLFNVKREVLFRCGVAFRFPLRETAAKTWDLGRSLSRCTPVP